MNLNLKEINTNLKALPIIEDAVYKYEYDDLNDYLRGVRDMINLLNGWEDHIEIAQYIVNQVENLQIKK